MSAVYASELERVEAENRALREQARTLERQLADARRFGAAASDLVDRLRAEIERLRAEAEPQLFMRES